MKSKLKILIATGIYPPQIGGPARYAKNLKESFEKIGHRVIVKTYGLESYLPLGLRHFVFFLKVFFVIPFVDAIIILDTFSVGLPTIFACKLLGQKGIIRTGGDFLWEQYVERTRKKVLFRNFYDTERSNFSLKEKIVFELTKWTLKNTDKVVFSTEWQKGIFIKVYELEDEKTTIVENYCGPKKMDKDFKSKTFVGSARKLIWKNTDVLEKVFDKVCVQHPEISLFMENLPYDRFVEELSDAYAVILVSLGDISPNIIYDAITYNRPFICTKENGIYDRISEAGLFVDPLDEKEIEEAILKLLTPEGYAEAKEKVRKFSFVHTWGEIADFFMGLLETLSEDDLYKSTNFLFKTWKRSIYLRYFTCGITSTVVNVSTLFLMTDKVGIWYLYSSIIAFFVSIMVSFTLQKLVVFKDKNTVGLHYQFLKFFVAVLLGVTTNTILVYILVDIAGIWYIFSQLVAGFFVMIQNFLFYKYLIFSREK